MMQNNSKKTKIIVYSVLYCIATVVFFLLVKEDWKKTDYSFESVMRGYTTQELMADNIYQQIVTIPIEQLESISFDINQWAEDDSLRLFSSVMMDGMVLWEGALPYAGIQADQMMTFQFDPPLIIHGKPNIVSLRGQGGISLWAGTLRSAGRFVVAAEDNNSLSVNDNPLVGQLVMEVHGFNSLHIMNWFWYVAGVLYLLGLLILVQILYKPNCWLGRIWKTSLRYRFLLQQMISRDFRIKYQASVMGVLWSFLNPMLMTVVYYFVFNSIFNNSTENFVIYLMSGIILFNFFSEATSLGLTGVVSNASLINKVFIPKYIFPISKVLSSSINLVMSFVPVLILMGVMGVRFTKALLFIPLLILLLIVFCIGISLIISCMYVFFRDMQFLWSLLLTVWMFLTPVFYPESIIPEAFIHLYHANPMYQMCAFARTIILNGVAPSPRNLLLCIVSAFVALLAGCAIFHKTQDHFALYL